VEGSSRELAVGSQIGRYEVVAPLHAGAMGTVYRARRRDSDLEVALKALIDPRDAARFEIEARLLGQLDHPRVVRVLEHFEHAGAPYLVMDLVEGPNLIEVLAERGDPGLPVDEAVDYTCQACEALAYIHAQHVIHRDIKPENLILGEFGIVLVDFGIATEFTLVDEGTIGIGTPRYMAPEVMAGGIVHPGSDVFGVAATLWTLLTGEPPMYGDDTALSEMAPGASRQLEVALRAGLAIDPHDRLPTAKALADALGAPVTASGGESLARSFEGPAPRDLLEAVVRAAAGVFEAASASIAVAESGGGLVYQAAWGTGGPEVLGMRLAPGEGLAGAVAASGRAEAVPDCRADERFAAHVAEATGYVPHTMMLLPLRRGEEILGVLSVLDRRDGSPFGPDDLVRAQAFGELSTLAVELHARGAAGTTR
jgi:eukaryotic-like serine/threonine-protein kinase